MKIKPGIRKTCHFLRSGCVFSAAFILFQNVACAEQSGKIRSYELGTSSSTGLILPNQMNEIGFASSENNIKGWLRESGDWYLEATIQHKSFLCGDYKVGVRFGRGNPSCVDVEWLTEIQYATHEKQCNNVTMNHSGYQTNKALVSHFNSITCAKIEIKCEGSC